MGKYLFSDHQDKRREDRRPKPKARSGLKKSGYPVKNKKPYRIKQRSKDEAKRMRRYNPIAKKYKEENPVCEFPGCNRPTTDVHHSEGREGELLFEVKKFKHLCGGHHRRVEDNPEEAMKLGLTVKRNGVSSKQPIYKKTKT